MLRKTLIPALATLAVVSAAPANAASGPTSAEYTNTAPIAVSEDDLWFVAMIDVTGQRGPITDVDLDLIDVDAAEPAGLLAALVSPSGESEIAIGGGICNDDVWTKRQITIDQSAGSKPPVDHCPSGVHYQPPGTGNNPACCSEVPGGPPYTGNFDNFNNENASGRWYLYVKDSCVEPERVDNCSPTHPGDAVIGAWRLHIKTGATAADVPKRHFSSGVADPYPWTKTASGSSGVVTDVNVVLDGFFHRYPDDLDILLQGPGGQKVMLMSDACGEYPMNAYGFEFDDEAAGQMADGGGGNVCDKRGYKPTDYQPGDSMPSPAPAGPYGTSLGVFDGVDPNGDWNLFVNDDFLGGEGFFTVPYTIELTTRPGSPVAFDAATKTLSEGQTGSLTITRGTPASTTGTVHVTTAPGTATAPDFVAIDTTVSFAAGEKTRTVPIKALTDGLTEGDETFTVDLGVPTHDAALASPSKVTVTIKDGGQGSGGGGGGGGGGGPVGTPTPTPTSTVVATATPTATATAQPTVTVTPPQGFGKSTGVTLGLAARRMRHGKARVRVANANPFAVAGFVAGRSVKLAGGQATTIAVPLSRRARRHLARFGTAKVTLVAELHDPIGTYRTVRKRATVTI
jgi:subtilisin-like proprotein convertase family protein